MLLQQIVETLDAELDRLHQLRAIVSQISLPLVMDVGEAEPETIETIEPEAAQPAPKQKGEPVRRRVAGAPRSRTASKWRAAEEVSALNGMIPAGPVVVNAEAVAKYHAAKQATKGSAKPAKAVGTLGLMIRAMQLDRTS